MATKSLKGKIGVTTENIFPVIKQFLYSDHEIFLRELVANAVDASQKMKALAMSGDFKGELGELKVSVELDEKKKVLRIADRGIGMTSEEVDKYINQIAFSSAGEFLEKYKDQIGSIIGHFGLGFYSAFMVAKKVTIDTLSWKEGSKPVRWSCDGSPEYSMEDGDRTDRGTVITLYLDDDAEEFASRGKISQLLGKYCKFMPVPVVFGKKTEWKDGKSVETDEDNVINNIEPIWTKAPADLKDEDYLKFYRELYPMEEEPLFWIHLNVDYPFTLTGVLYFPKIRERMAIDKNKIQLYCNQMFVTDHVDNIVPDFLTLLHGVIDSPDIPLNVSRSYLQSDANVKKISTYITKKVADRLEEIFKEQRPQLEQKWDNIKLFIEYGMLSDEKFRDRAMSFALLKNTDGKYFSLEEYRKAIESSQKGKDGNVVYLYATDLNEQYSFIEAAKNMGYDVLLMDCELDSHFVNMLETKLEHSRFARVDSDSVDKLVQKEDSVQPELAEDDKKALDEMFKAVLPEGNEYVVEARNLGENAAPVLITQSEFLRRYREMSSLGGGMNFYGSIPQSYNVIVNMQNPVVAKIWEAKGAENKEEDLLHQVVDLALLSNGMLKGKALADFVERSAKLLGR
ncbi:MAG TPA: molecular chaperone HtpG [Candidatus Cryptobacteroides pullicola]|nr:molecular chaperone HtpG [Candidatus Cryptobacteroides pullicola]